jgi:hypothetical protein
VVEAGRAEGEQRAPEEGHLSSLSVEGLISLQNFPLFFPPAFSSFPAPGSSVQLRRRRGESSVEATAAGGKIMKQNYLLTAVFAAKVVSRSNFARSRSNLEQTVAADACAGSLPSASFGSSSKRQKSSKTTQEKTRYPAGDFAAFSSSNRRSAGKLQGFSDWNRQSNNLADSPLCSSLSLPASLSSSYRCSPPPSATSLHHRTLSTAPRTSRKARDDEHSSYRIGQRKQAPDSCSAGR